eukprot:gene17188-23507_t
MQFPELGTEIMHMIICFAAMDDPQLMTTAVSKYFNSVINTSVPHVLVLRVARRAALFEPRARVLFTVLSREQQDARWQHVASEVIRERSTMKEAQNILIVLAELNRVDLMEPLLLARQLAPLPNYDDGITLQVASSCGSVEAPMLLMNSHGGSSARANSGNNRSLMFASLNNHPAVVSVLLDAGEHASHADCCGGWALTAAIKGGQDKIERILVMAEVHACDASAWDSEWLLLAIEGGHTSVVRELLAAPANAAQANSRGGAALIQV